ncbi:MAG: hypothetical protein ABEJ69_02200 [Candidatus Nanohaloarchaea archaeon]
MAECSFCGEEFDSEHQLHLHWDEHREELNSHQEEKVNKAQRKKRDEKQKRRQRYEKYVYTAAGIVVLIGLAAGAYTLIPEGSPGTGNIGPAGSAHYHADFAVYINGEKFDFSKRSYQVVDRRAHVEGLSDDVVHAHASGVTFGYFMETLGWGYNATALETRNNTYFEKNGKELRMFVNEGDGWKEIEPRDYLFSDGDQILLAYGDYTKQEIKEMQKSVTDKTPI